MNLEDLYRLLRSGHVQALGIVETIDSPILVLDGSLCVVNTNPAFLKHFAVNRDDTVGRELRELGNGQWDIPELTGLLRDVIPKSAALVGYEVTHEFPAIGRRTLLLTARRLCHPDSNSLFMLLVFEDVTDQRSNEMARDLILSEIEHRLRNFFGLVESLARQVPANGGGAVEYRDALIARLNVLASAELAVFSGSDNTLLSLIGTLLAPYGDKLKIEGGPEVALDGKHLRPFNLIFHELATNAMKYGAFSADGGCVHVDWNVTGKEPPRLLINWREEGGPKLDSAGGEGFGTLLIKSSVKELGGKIDEKFDPEGLKVSIEVPLGT